jgi:carbonic anhydrase
MKRYQQMLLENKAWAKEMLEGDAEFFTRMASSQKPEFLWIGCSDSRVSPTEITQTQPGEIFIHRNVANVVVHTDFNLLSVLQYAVEVLEISHVIVCGHYGCGGVQAALSNNSYGMIDIWLRHIKDAYCLHKHDVDTGPESERLNRMVEANVKQQLMNLAKTTIIQKSWKAHKRPYLHGWVYDMAGGIVKPLVELAPHQSIDDPIYTYEPFKA